MENKFLLFIVVLIILCYLKKSNIQETQKSKIFFKGKKVKKIFKVEPLVSIEEQVKINNNSGFSPKIIKYGKNFIEMERADITLRDMFYYFKLDRKKIEKLIKLFRKLDKYEYSHNDLNWRNIMWNGNVQEFQVIDWEFSSPNLEKSPLIKNDMEFLKYNVRKITFNLEPRIVDLGCKMLENIYFNRGFIENLKGLWILFNY